jgi:hypothetical protein
MSRIRESDNYAHPAWVNFMDAASLREKAALCLRIAKGLSWNNPGRLELTDLAERLDCEARESEWQNLAAKADNRKAAGARG